MIEKLPPLPNLEELIDDEGQITIGAIEPIECAAIATAGRQPLAMLVRRDGEALSELLTRLDAAVAMADESGSFIDEINNGPDARS
jgi:hypothetical protein